MADLETCSHDIPMSQPCVECKLIVKRGMLAYVEREAARYRIEIAELEVRDSSRKNKSIN